jgi:hypothetical protein
MVSILNASVSRRSPPLKITREREAYDRGVPETWLDLWQEALKVVRGMERRYFQRAGHHAERANPLRRRH